MDKIGAKELREVIRAERRENARLKKINDKLESDLNELAVWQSCVRELDKQLAILADSIMNDDRRKFLVRETEAQAALKGETNAG